MYINKWYTELNELIYAGAKLVCDKIGIPSKSTKEKSKPGWEFRLETQIKKKLLKQLKIIKHDPDVTDDSHGDCSLTADHKKRPTF